MSDIVEVLNEETGERGQIRRKWFDNPAINAGILVEVDPRQKPYVPELFHSKVEDDLKDTPVYAELTEEEDVD